MPKAFLTVGAPGSGKSTFAKKLLQKEYHSQWIEINLDHCRFLVSGDEGNQSCTPEAVKIHNKMIDDAIASNQNIIVSDTNLNPQFRIALVKKLKSAGFSVEYLVFDVLLDELFRRNQQRDRKVPDHVIKRLHDQMQDFLVDHQQIKPLGDFTFKEE